MGDNQPKRPPRSNRVIQKDPSAGILMSVIKTLTSSYDSEDRDKEKAKLESNFKESDDKLNKYVVEYKSDLTFVMQAYSKISTHLVFSKNKLKETREKLVTCQQLLHCKRDELKKLYLESMENKYVLELLDQIEDVCNANNKIKKLVEKKQYLTATKLLVESLNNLKTNLNNIEALKEIKADLENCQDQIYEALIEELQKCLYIDSLNICFENFNFTDEYEMKKNVFLGSQNGLKNKKISVIDMLSPAINNQAQNKRKNSLNMNKTNFNVTEDININDIEKEPLVFISILVQCLNLLNKTEDAIQIIKDQTETELLNVVKRTEIKILDKVNNESKNKKKYLEDTNNLNLNLMCTLRSNAILTNSNHNAYLLLDLCYLLFQQFRNVAQMHEQLLIPMFRNIENNYNSQEINKSSQKNFNIYNMAEIWNKIQKVLNIVIDLYLDANGSNNQNQLTNSKLSSNKASIDNSNNFNKNFDLNSYFVKKRVGLSAAVQAGNQLINKQNFLNNIQNMSYGQSSQNKKNSLFKFELRTKY